MAWAGIGEKIKVARKRAGMTQGELARAVGVTTAVIHHWESEKSSPLLTNLKALCEALQIHPIELIVLEARADGVVQAELTKRHEKLMLELYRKLNWRAQQNLLQLLAETGRKLDDTQGPREVEHV